MLIRIKTSFYQEIIGSANDQVCDAGVAGDGVSEDGTHPGASERATVKMQTRTTTATNHDELMTIKTHDRDLNS